MAFTSESLPARRRCRRLGAALLTLAAGLAAAPPVAAQASDPAWTMRVGVTFPSIAVSDALDTSSPAVTRRRSALTFPRLTVARDAGPFDLEAGYRKLGVVRYDGAAVGNTHSNALQLAAAWPGAPGRGWRIALRGGLQIVRTVTTVSATPATWTVVSAKNTFRVLPVAAVTAGFQGSTHWGVAAEFEPLLGVLGERGVTDRYRQRLLGIDLVHRR